MGGGGGGVFVWVVERLKVEELLTQDAGWDVEFWYCGLGLVLVLAL